MQRIKSLLVSDQELRPLLTKVQTLAVLQNHFRGVAPPHLVQSAQVLGLHQGILHIAVANATLAAKLRQLVPELVANLQNRGCEVSGIHLKVQVSFAHAQPKPKPRKLGKPAQNALHELSLSLRDTPLKQAINKLAQKDR